MPPGSQASLKPPPPRLQSRPERTRAGGGACACTGTREDGRAGGAHVRRQRHPTVDPRPNVPCRARRLNDNRLGPDGARALAPALEKMVGLKELKCVPNAVLQPSLAQTSPAALAVSRATTSGRTGRVRSHWGSRSGSGYCSSSVPPTPPGNRPPLTPLLPSRLQSRQQQAWAGGGACACTGARGDGRAEGAQVRLKCHPAARPRSSLPLHACSLGRNELGPEGARALAPALEKMVGLEELMCAANATRQSTPAQTSPAALAGSTTIASVQTGPVRLHQRSRRWSG